MIRQSINLLVIESQPNLNWYAVFDGVFLSDGTKVVVEQGTWDDFVVISYDQPGVMVQLRKKAVPLPGSTQGSERTFVVDFVLVRSVVRGIKGVDNKNKLIGLIHGGLDGVNSLLSSYLFLDRPIVYGELRKIKKRLGKEFFPVVSQSLFTDHKTMLFPPDFPIVAKVAHPHSGFGKMKFIDNTQYSDFRGLVAIHNDYVSVESYYQWDCDIRIQKIGSDCRVYKRSHPNYWKGSTDNEATIEEIEMTEEYQFMIDEASQIFGGLDICSIELIKNEKGDGEYILDLNAYTQNWIPEHDKEDMELIFEVVMEKMEKKFIEKYDITPELNAELLDTMKDDFSDNINELIRVERETIVQLKAQLLQEESSEEDIKKHPLVWLQSIIIVVMIVLLGLLYQSV